MPYAPVATTSAATSNSCCHFHLQLWLLLLPPLASSKNNELPLDGDLVECLAVCFMLRLVLWFWLWFSDSGYNHDSGYD